MFNNKSILVTGGTGSFGKNFVRYVLRNYKNINKLIIFSRDEYKQHILKNYFTNKERKKIRFFLGDIRDKNRLLQAFEGLDIIVHAAALKQVPAAEYNPQEYIKTNIIGSQNIIEAAIEKNIKKVLSLSTDKAVAPINLYGATKLCSDKLFMAANNIKGNRKLTFSILRYGNVMLSRGSVLSIYKENKYNTFPVTDKRMTRFSLTLDESIKAAIDVLKIAKGGEIFIPKINSYRILDVVRAISPKAKIKVIGIRPGEKLHEELISSGETGEIYDSKKFYIICPQKDKNYERKYKKYKKENYISNKNKFYSIKQLKTIIESEYKKILNDPLF